MKAAEEQVTLANELLLFGGILLLAAIILTAEVARDLRETFLP